MFSPDMKNFDNPLPPDQVRFLDLYVEPWEDKKRLKVFVKITQFTTPPNLSFQILDNQDVNLSEVTLIENVDTDIVFTMHLRSQNEQEDLTLKGEIFYSEEIGQVDKKEIAFTL